MLTIATRPSDLAGFLMGEPVLAGRISSSVRNKGKVNARASLDLDGEATQEDFARLSVETRAQTEAYEQLTKRPGQGFRRKKPTKSDP